MCLLLRCLLLGFPIISRGVYLSKYYYRACLLFVVSLVGGVFIGVCFALGFYYKGVLKGCLI